METQASPRMMTEKIYRCIDCSSVAALFRIMEHHERTGHRFECFEKKSKMKKFLLTRIKTTDK